MAKKGRGKKKPGVELTEDERIERDVKNRRGNDIQDEIDDFHDAREEVKLAGGADDSDDSDGDMEQPETMLDLDLSEESSSDDGSGDMDDEDDEDDTGEQKFGWGKKKSTFYGDDDDDDDDEDEDDDMELAEEEEAVRLQKERAALLQEDDFGLGDEEAFEELENKKKGKKGAKALGRSDTKLLSKVNAELDDIEVDDLEHVEVVTRNLSKLSESEKFQVLVNDSPELLTLLEEFKENIADLRTRIQPLLKRVEKGELPTSHGVSFLELKSHLLLNYCLNFSFYVLLKAEGKSVRDHPVVSQLVKIRTVLEKMKPIDNKLKYQVDKLMRTATAPETGENDEDALKFKPNPDGLVSKGDEDGEDDIYRAPRLAAVQFEDSEALKDKKDRLKEKKKLKASRSSMVKALQEEFGDAPEESTALGLAIQADDEKDAKERQRYEEDNMIRLQLTKADKKKQKKGARMKIDDFADFDDFGDLADVTRDNTTKEEALNQLKKKSLGDYISKIEQGRKKAVVGGDDDLPRQDREAKIRANLKRKTNIAVGDDDDNEFFGGGGRGVGSDGEVDDGFYNEAKRSHQEKKQKRQDKYSIDRPVHDPDTDISDGRRKTNYQIEKNKGLTPHRKKDVRNSRVKLRNKFDKANVKRKSTVRPVASQSAPYGGEATGIKANISRSVKIRN